MDNVCHAIFLHETHLLIDSHIPHGRLAQENEKWTRACSEGLTASQSAPDGSYGPYDHIISMGNARGANFEARARKNLESSSSGAD